MRGHSAAMTRYNDAATRSAASCRLESALTEKIVLTDERLRGELRRLESDQGMPALEFYDRYRAGERGDSLQVMHWAGICYMALRRGILSRQPMQAPRA